MNNLGVVCKYQYFTWSEIFNFWAGGLAPFVHICGQNHQLSGLDCPCSQCMLHYCPDRVGHTVHHHRLVSFHLNIVGKPRVCCVANYICTCTVHTVEKVHIATQYTREENVHLLVHGVPLNRDQPCVSSFIIEKKLLMMCQHTQHRTYVLVTGRGVVCQEICKFCVR